MSEKVCPYLGTLDQENNQRSGIEYPSFENICFAQSVPTSGTLLLADQATYCLSGGYHQCPRYQLLQATPTISNLSSDQFGGQIASHYPAEPEPYFDPTTSLPLESDVFSQDLSGRHDGHDAPFQQSEPFGASRAERSRLLWIASGATFLSVFLCGIVFAVYAGWQLVSNNLLAATEAATAGAVDPLAVAQPTPTAATVVIVITSQPAAGQENAQASGPVEQVAEQVDPNRPPRDFPIAVTPTPIVVDPNAGAQQAEVAQPAVAEPAVAQPAIVEVVPPTATPASQIPVPEIPVSVVVPSPRPRQPTPDFLVPPNLEEEPSPTPLPTATWPPPIVIFAPEDKILAKGKCTMVRWAVENVRAVYYENLEVIGTGEKEECIDDEGDVFLLNVVLPNGSSKIYTTSVEFLEPTATPTATETFTPEPRPTETWTPQPPTVTPTPDWILATTLRTAEGNSTISCAAGTTCDVGLLVSNGGNVVDTLEIALIEEGAWPPQICRQDGVCSPDRLVLSNVGEGNTAYITLRLSIPADATQATTTYTLRSTSQLSEGRITSEALALTVNLE